MNEKIKHGFTLVFSGEYGNISGGYLRSTEKGNFPISLGEEEVTVLSEFPLILENLQDEKILQLYFDNDNIVTMLGKRKYDALETKDEYLEVDSVAFGNTVSLALSNLSKKLEDKNSEKSYQKAYKISGSDKYQILKNRNENIGG